MIESNYARIQKDNLQIIDVRAPVEFEEGHLPQSLNIPILNNDERSQVGTLYKKAGKDAAIRLGNQLVSGPIKDQRVASWLQAVQHKPSVILCFRGGLRSQTAQAWVREAGAIVDRVEGGYKGFRRFLTQQYTDWIETEPQLHLVTGMTGVGKSMLLGQLSSSGRVVDLERLAKHRGSAFGKLKEAQPHQATFENLLFSRLSQMRGSVIVEDESRMVGKIVLPERLFQLMRASSVVVLDESIEQRVTNIFADYVTHSGILSDEESERLRVYGYYNEALKVISRKLGGLRYQEISSQLREAWDQQNATGETEKHRLWIRALIESYYDPLYTRSFTKRAPAVTFRGAYQEVLEFLRAEASKGQ